MTEEFEVKIGRVSLEGFSTAELVVELFTRTDYNVVYKHDDGTLSIDLASIIPLMETSKLVEELSKRDGVEVYDVEGDVYLQRDGGGYKVRLYKSKRLVVRE